jgi:hypothetical protein
VDELAETQWERHVGIRAQGAEQGDAVGLELKEAPATHLNY